MEAVAFSFRSLRSGEGAFAAVRAGGVGRTGDGSSRAVTSGNGACAGGWLTFATAAVSMRTVMLGTDWIAGLLASENCMGTSATT